MGLKTAGIQDSWIVPASVEKEYDWRYLFYHYTLRDSAGLWVAFFRLRFGFFNIFSEDSNFW